MSHDPKFSQSALIEWLERQPADGEYCFDRWNDCLLAQWLSTIDPTACTKSEFPTGFHYEVSGQVIDLRRFQPVATSGPCTFGAALERARKLAAAWTTPTKQKAASSTESERMRLSQRKKRWLKGR